LIRRAFWQRWTALPPMRGKPENLLKFNMIRADQGHFPGALFVLPETPRAP
jgi:hypothetical protein